MKKAGTWSLVYALRIFVLMTIMVFSYTMATVPACAMDIQPEETQGNDDCHDHDGAPAPTQKTEQNGDCCDMTACCHLMDPMIITLNVVSSVTPIQLSLSHQSFELMQLDYGIERPPRPALV
jgi:hypothetical protein